MAFEVASIKPSKPGTFIPPNFPLDAGDAYSRTGGRFSGDFQLATYIKFAWAETEIDDWPDADPDHRSYRAPY